MTTWVTAVVWNKLAETAQLYLRKGSKVAVLGRLRGREYERQDGSRGTAVEVIADSLEFLSSRPRGDAEAEVPAEGDTAAPPAAGGEDAQVAA